MIKIKIGGGISGVGITVGVSMTIGAADLRRPHPIRHTLRPRSGSPADVGVVTTVG